MTVKKTREEVRAGIQEVLRAVFGRGDVEVRDGTTAGEIEGWDSISHVTVITAIEQRFRVRFTLREIARLGDVGQLVDLVLLKGG
jgi:acyl carrier protein